MNLLATSLLVLLTVPHSMPSDPDDSGAQPSAELLTIAESSDFHATARHRDVLALIEALAHNSPLARRAEMGRTSEGRSIPLLIVADPPVADARDAAAAVQDGRVLCLIFANIHAGEVCGKAASLMLARELLAEPQRADHAALLRHLVIVFAPIFNGDGNERMAPDNRPGQLGPDEMGTRANAMGLDLNRDDMKLESPEVSARLKARSGFEAFAYGNFEDDHSRWATYRSLPRFGAQYHGLRGELSILSEAYSHIPFKERVLATREFVRECLSWTADHADEVREAYRQGQHETVALGRAAAEGHPEPVGIRHMLSAAPEPATVRGWVETLNESGESVPTSKPRDYIVEHLDHFEPNAFVDRPAAYLVPARFTAVAELLRRHGVQLTRWADTTDQPSPLIVERYVIEEAEQGGNRYLGHATPDVSATPQRSEHTPAPDDWIVTMAQPMGTLALQLLGPEAEDSLAPLLLGEFLVAGGEYPLLRVVR